MTEPTPIRLLVVDDHNLFRRGLVALLAQDARLQVVGEAADANEALSAARRLKPDLILLDHHLPGVHGVDAIADLKQLLPDARVLMLTVSENEHDLAAGLRAGADGYLLKTIHTEALCESICKVWEGDAVISPEMMGKLVSLVRAPVTQVINAASDGADAELQRGATVGVGTQKAASMDGTLSMAGTQGTQGTQGASGMLEPVQTQVPSVATEDGNNMPPANTAPLPDDDPIHTLSPREVDILRLIVRGDSNKHIARALDIAETTVKIHVQHILRKLGLANRVHAAVYATERGITPAL